MIGAGKFQFINCLYLKACCCSCGDHHHRDEKKRREWMKWSKLQGWREKIENLSFFPLLQLSFPLSPLLFPVSVCDQNWFVNVCKRERKTRRRREELPKVQPKRYVFPSSRMERDMFCEGVILVSRKGMGQSSWKYISMIVISIATPSDREC